MSNTVTHETCPTCGTITVHNLAAYMDELNAEPDDPPVILHNGQPVNLDAILDLAADVGAGPQPFDKAVDWEGTLINYMARLHNKHHALSPTDQAFLAERLEGG